MTKIRKLLALTIFNVIVVTLVFLFCEGLSSTILIVNRFVKISLVAERLHTEYDETLGWINLPNTYIADMYGPNIYLKTNKQRFRNNIDFSLRVPKNKTRIICSGDSFTLGYGVDNDHTWCQLLATINGQVETVNMGQGGYGIDQAYLWYKRDGSKLDLDIHVFGFITSDFRRMQSDKFLNYDKPILELYDGILVTKNVPVPEPSFFRVWLNRNQSIISNLSSIRLLQKLLFQKTPVKSNKSDNQTRQVALKIFQDMQQVNQTKNSVLVLVYLPTKGDYIGNASEPWRQFLHTEAAKHNLLYIDLVGEFKELPSETIKNMFIAKGVMNYQGAAGHYTEEGNAYIARALYDKLLRIPEISEKLEP